MSEPSSPARTEKPARDPGSAPPRPGSAPPRGPGSAPPRAPGSAPPPDGGQAPRQQASAQKKIVALALALVILAALYFVLFGGSTGEQVSAPPEEEAEIAAEGEAEEPAPAPPLSPMADPVPSTHASAPGSEGPPLPPLNVLSVGYSPSPAHRVVALRIGGALPYFLHEGDTVGTIKIVAIMQDRVQISHKSKTYEIRVGSDGKPIGEPKLMR